ncbi:MULTISPECIES: permease-like cell division protein FtsX [Streptacidiphilus]|uniref:Cell division protein FtsX n=2 Tax=Streptacidiphilus TaxID=228398 RepID=A0ABV6UDY9_9ACTN|nr:permease-like cell division protein FtsX [Streptacidiphilus jeojiense]
MRAQFVMSEIGIGLRRNLTMTIAVVVSVALSLALAGAALLLRDQVSTMKGYWDGKIEVSVYFCNKTDANQGSVNKNCSTGAATQNQIDSVQSQLEKTGLIEKIYTETPAQALAEYTKQDPNNPLLTSLTPDSMEYSLRIKLKDPQNYQIVTGLVGGQPGVMKVEDQSEVLKPLFNLLNGAQVVALVVMVIMLGVTLLLIVNTVRVSAFSRKRETGIMRLVGASNYYVQMPFIAEAAFAAVVGAVLASGMLAVGKYLLIDRFLKNQIQLINFIGWGPVFQVMPLMLVLGVGMSSIAAFLTLRKYLKV